jgi:hypothetical protein
VVAAYALFIFFFGARGEYLDCHSNGLSGVDKENTAIVAKSSHNVVSHLFGIF